MEPTTFTTGRLLLRPFADSDTDEVHAACQDPDIQRWTVVPSPYSRPDAEFFTGKLSPDGWADDSMYNFAVVLRESGPWRAPSASVAAICRARTRSASGPPPSTGAGVT